MAKYSVNSIGKKKKLGQIKLSLILRSPQVRSSFLFVKRHCAPELNGMVIMEDVLVTLSRYFMTSCNRLAVIFSQVTNLLFNCVNSSSFVSIHMEKGTSMHCEYDIIYG